MTKKIEQVSQPPDGCVFIIHRRAGKFPRAGLRAEIVSDLRRPVDSGGAMEVADRVQYSQFNAGRIDESRTALELSKPPGHVQSLEILRLLRQELNALEADFNLTELLRDDDLKNHRRLVGGAVDRRRLQQ